MDKKTYEDYCKKFRRFFYENYHHKIAEAEQLYWKKRHKNESKYTWAELREHGHEGIEENKRLRDNLEKVCSDVYREFFEFYRGDHFIEAYFGKTVDIDVESV